MAYEKIFTVLAVIFIICAVGVYLYSREFSILLFCLILAGMASGRYSNRLGRLRVLRSDGVSEKEKLKIAQRWSTEIESRSDRFATNYVTPLIICIGLIIALLKRSMEVFYFVLLLIIIDAVDRMIIHRLDKHSQLLLDEQSASPEAENG